MSRPRCGHAQTQHIVDAAVAAGWQYTGTNGNDHGVLVWPATGQVVKFSMHRPSDVNAPRNIAKAIEQISGVATWQRGSRKPGKFRPSRGFDLEAAVREREAGVGLAATVERLHAEHETLTSEFRQLPAERASVQHARRLLHAIRNIEARLAGLHQPCEVFRGA